jgi:hypothetical protein
MIHKYLITYISFLSICHNQCIVAVILVAIIYVPIFLFDGVYLSFAKKIIFYCKLCRYHNNIKKCMIVLKILSTLNSKRNSYK